MQNDVLFASPQRAAQSNLARALGDAGEHDVHDYNAAHHEKYRGEPNGHVEEIGRQGLPQAHDGIRADDAKGIRPVPGNVPPGAQKHAGFVLGGRHDFRVLRLDKQDQRVALRAPFLAERFQGNEDEIILRLSKSAADDCRHANDLVAVCPGANGFADGIHVGEKLLDQVIADKTYGRVVFLVGFRYEAPRGDIDAANLGEVGGHSIKIDVFKQVIAIAHVGVRSEKGGDLVGRAHAGL